MTRSSITITARLESGRDGRYGEITVHVIPYELTDALVGIGEAAEQLWFLFPDGATRPFKVTKGATVR